MKRLIIAACLALAGCATSGGLNTPAAIASRTVGSADAAYIAASTAGQTLVAAGTLEQAKFRQLDNDAYAALLSLRANAAAVRNGTVPATDLTTANARFMAAIAALRAGK